MSKSYKDEGLIIKKRKLLNGQYLVTIFTQHSGKLTFSAFGVKKLTSRRLSHFEIGNYVSFVYFKKGEYNTLAETELKFGHLAIKESEDRLNVMFLIFNVLNSILPEDEQGVEVLKETLHFLNRLNKTNLTRQDLELFLTHILLIEGFLDQKKIHSRSFDIFSFIEELINRKIDKSFNLDF